MAACALFYSQKQASRLEGLWIVAPRFTASIFIVRQANQKSSLRPISCIGFMSPHLAWLPVQYSRRVVDDSWCIYIVSAQLLVEHLGEPQSSLICTAATRSHFPKQNAFFLHFSLSGLRYHCDKLSLVNWSTSINQCS